MHINLCKGESLGVMWHHLRILARSFRLWDTDWSLALLFWLVRLKGKGLTWFDFKPDLTRSLSESPQHFEEQIGIVFSSTNHKIKFKHQNFTIWQYRTCPKAGTVRMEVQDLMICGVEIWLHHYFVHLCAFQNHSVKAMAATVNTSAHWSMSSKARPQTAG